MSKLDIFCRNWEVLLFLGYREEDILTINVNRDGMNLISRIMILMDDGEEYDLLV